MEGSPAREGLLHQTGENNGELGTQNAPVRLWRRPAVVHGCAKCRAILRYGREFSRLAWSMGYGRRTANT